jgi:hypothetical protein
MNVAVPVLRLTANLNPVLASRAARVTRRVGSLSSQSADAAVDANPPITTAMATDDLSATSAGPGHVPASPGAVAVVATTASALVDNPEKHPTHWHPAVPSTSAPLPPTPEPGAASC